MTSAAAYIAYNQRTMCITDKARINMRIKITSLNLILITTLVMISTSGLANCPSSLSGTFAGTFLETDYSSNTYSETYIGDTIATFTATNGTNGTYSEYVRDTARSNGSTGTITNTGTYSYSRTTCSGTISIIKSNNVSRLQTYNFVLVNNGNTIQETTNGLSWYGAVQVGTWIYERL
jgi:hypothetical protein